MPVLWIISKVCGIIPVRRSKIGLSWMPPSEILWRNRIDWFVGRPLGNAVFPSGKTPMPGPAHPPEPASTGKNRRNAPVLLFGRESSAFSPAAETKCMHCHGTEIAVPSLSTHLSTATLFEQADQARGLCPAKDQSERRHPGREHHAPATYELPPDAIGEAIVNAIAHRDYTTATPLLRSASLPTASKSGTPAGFPAADARESAPDHPSIARQSSASANRFI